MRILQICSARDIGGGERHVADLANSLVERGHEVFAAVNPNTPLIDRLHSLPKENIVELPMRGAADVLAAERLAQLVRENAIDIIHAHLARDYPLAALASARSGRTPFVLTRHVLFPLGKVHRLLLRRAARVIAVSKAVDESLRDAKIFDSSKIVVIHNGIDAARFSQKTPRARSAGYVVGTIGHIAAIKGQDIFVKAASIIAGKRNDVEFAIVGEDKSSDGASRASLEASIAQLGLRGRVRLTGWDDDVANTLRSFEIFVSPSRSEPFGLVMLEAMAAGVPVVATGSEGASEIIEDGVTGILVPIADAEAMAAAILNLIDDSSLRQRLRENSLIEVDRRFSLEAMVAATEKIYGEVLKR